MIFWENDQRYILSSSIEFEELLAIEEEDMPRPLINMFRIGLGISSLDEFKSTIRELMESGSKRSSANAKLNEKVNKHIKAVWREYDQDMQISIEQSQIRIEIFYPKRDSDAGFLNYKKGHKVASHFFPSS